MLLVFFTPRGPVLSTLGRPVLLALSLSVLLVLSQPISFALDFPSPAPLQLPHGGIDAGVHDKYSVHQLHHVGNPPAPVVEERTRRTTCYAKRQQRGWSMP